MDVPKQPPNGTFSSSSNTRQTQYLKRLLTYRQQLRDSVSCTCTDPFQLLLNIAEKTSANQHLARTKQPASLFCTTSCCSWDLFFLVRFSHWVATCSLTSDRFDEKLWAASSLRRARVSRDVQCSLESCGLYRNSRSTNHSCCSNLWDYDSGSGSVGFLGLIR